MSPDAATPDEPDVLAEVTAAFRRYERALVSNDIETLDDLFWDDGRTLRYGVGENLYGHAEIAAFRAARPAAGLARTLARTVITTFGREFATASTEFRRDGMAGVGRQTQSWVRFPEGWRIVAAHVSVLPGAAMNGPGQMVDNAGVLFGIALRPEWREAAAVHFVALEAAAALVMGFPLDDEAEYGPVFAP